MEFLELTDGALRVGPFMAITLGINWDWNKNWSVMAEAGFGGSRENFYPGAAYRI